MKFKNRKILYLIIGGLILLLAIWLVASQIKKQTETRSKAAGEAVTFSLTPASQDVVIGNTFQINVSLDAKTNNITGVDLTLQYNPQVSDAVSFQPAGNFNTELIKTIDPATGTVRFATVNTGTTVLSGVMPIGTLTLTGKSQGSGTLALQKAQITASGIQTEIPLDPTTAATYTVSTLPTPTSPAPPADTTKPTVTITYPADASVISRRSSLTITATATDDVGVSRVVFTAGGNSFTDTTAPYSYAWSVSGKPNATYTITATAFDQAGNSAVDTVQVKTNK
ncbi:MAG: hypothetical protein HYV40_04765 [Candidatus Levybacteria bacterium]|nr:hypothetical protein [Candidatus Levybacteria bacterium]